MSIRKGNSIIAGNISQNIDSEFSLTSNNPVKNSVITNKLEQTLDYKNITNCVTEIPQDIKLELNAGTLTLKAGSKVYVPNGAGVFNDGITTVDKTPGLIIGPDGIYLCYSSIAGLSIYTYLLSQSGSGSSLPADGSQYKIFYNTTDNKIYQWGIGSSSWQAHGVISLPIAIVTVSSGAITSIDQVFNGFGYIGSTVFALPGVKGLIPDGRNVDGTLKNIEFATSSVLTIGYDVSYDNYKIALNSNYIGVYVSHPIDRLEYKEQENINYNNYANNIERIACVGYISCNGTQITTLEPKNAFHAVDYNEADFVIAYQTPNSSNDYTWYRLYKSGWVEQGGIIMTSGISNISLPITMKDTNYSVMISMVNDDNFNNQRVVKTNSLTTTSFQLTGSTTSTGGVMWEVKGMSA